MRDVATPRSALLPYREKSEHKSLEIFKVLQNMMDNSTAKGLILMLHIVEAMCM